MTLAGPDRHLNEQSAHKEIRVSDEEHQNPCDKIGRKVENISIESIIKCSKYGSTIYLEQKVESMPVWIILGHH